MPLIIVEGTALTAPERTAGLPMVVLRKVGAGEAVAADRLLAMGELAGEGARAERRLLMGERGREEGALKGVVFSLRAFGGEMGGGGGLLRSRCIDERVSEHSAQTGKGAYGISLPLPRSSPSSDPPYSLRFLPARPSPI